MHKLIAYILMKISKTFYWYSIKLNDPKMEIGAGYYGSRIHIIKRYTYIIAGKKKIISFDSNISREKWKHLVNTIEILSE